MITTMLVIQRRIFFSSPSMIIRLAITITIAITIIIMLTICGVPRQAVLLLLLLLKHPSRPIYVPEKKIRMREEEEVEPQRDLEEDDCDGKNPSRNNGTQQGTPPPPPATTNPP